MDYYTRNMLSQIRKVCDEQIKIELPKECIIKENMLLGKDTSMLNEEAQTQDAQQPYVITSQNVQFGSVRTSQEDAIRKTVGDVSLKPDALKYYPQIQDLVLNAEVSGLGVTFQFRYKDPSGDGCYIWAEGLQLSDANLRTVEKIRDAFLNWKESLVQDGDLLEKLNKEANKN